MKSLASFIFEAMMDANSEGGIVNGIEILGRDVDIDIDGSTVNVEPKSNRACIFLNGNKAKDMDLVLNLKDPTGVQIDGGNVKSINIETTGAPANSFYFSNVTKCDTIDLSKATVDGVIMLDTCKGVKTFVGPQGQFTGAIRKNANLQTLDLSAADSIGVNNQVSNMSIDHNKALKNIRMPQKTTGNVTIDCFTPEELVKAGLKTVEGTLYCADKAAIFEPGKLGKSNFGADGGLKPAYKDWKYLKNGKLTVPTL